MNKLLGKRNTIYGLCAIWIVLFHSFRRIGMPYIPILTNIIGIGNMGVDIFFFFSGLCLSLSVKKRNYPEIGWKEYYRRRFTRVIVPYLIICVPYYLWAAAFETSGRTIRKIIAFIADLSSASFWIRGTQTTWYVYGIVAFYLMFPLLYRFLMSADRRKHFGLLIGLIAFAVVTAYIPVLKNSMIVWARLPIFTIGVIVGIEEEKFPKPGRAVVLISSVILFTLGFLTSMSEISESFTIPQVYRFIIYIPMTLALMIILSRIGRKVELLEWIGGLSLEVYLVHITLLHPIKYYGIMEAVGYWLYLILPLIVVPIAWIVGRIEGRILKK